MDELAMPPISLDEADAGGLVEGQQTSDDDVPLCCGCRDKEQVAEMRPYHPFIQAQ